MKGGVEGTQVVEEVRRHLGVECPTLVVTADTNPKVIGRIRDKGFPVLIKPVSPPSLRVMMHNILYEPELLRDLKNSEGGGHDE